MITLEKDIEQKFCRMVKNQGGMTVKFQDPSRKGAPDRLVIWEEVFFVEFKRPQGKLAPHQIKYAKDLGNYGVAVFLIDNEDEINDIAENGSFFCSCPLVKDIAL